VEATFTVRAVDFRGEARTDGGDAVEAELVVAAGGGAGADECKEGGGGGAAAAVAEARVAVAVVDGGDGTYACAYTADAEGRAALHVRMLGAPIRGSPFSVMVRASVLLTTAHEAQLREWCPGGAPRLELLVRATRDGWTAADFHRLCDNQGATATVVRSTNGNVFGGFADAAWHSSGTWQASAQAFLFLLVSHEGRAPARMAQHGRSPEKAMACYASYGPFFGYGSDLRIATNANASAASISNVGSTYTLPAGADAKTVLAGSHKFQVAEYEVFRVR
jgi:hypothetical protein